MPRFLLNLADDMVERMELDLADKVRDSYIGTGVEPNVYGVFSLDDLENKSKNELSQKIAIGVGYMGAEPTSIETNSRGSVSPGQSTASRATLFRYVVILAAPAGAECLERYTATQLLTIMRRSILGSVIADDAVQRRWSFEKEGPQLSESSEDMLYYAQVWTVTLMINGPKQ